MHLILDIIDGPAVGKSFRCGSERETTVGRTADAHVPLTDDFFLSRLHFCVRRDQATGEWSVRDLESRHGTFLNGERISQAVLADGDELSAGKCTFRIRCVESTDDNGGPAAAATGVIAAAAVFAAASATRRPPSAAPTYRRAKCPSELITLTGTEPEPSPASVAWQLAREVPLYLLADFAKASLAIPPRMGEVDFLFNWMDREVLPHCSPVLLGPEDPIDPFEVVDQFWRKDAVLCLFSVLPKPELLLRLRAAIRRDDGTSSSVPKGILGYCWPEAARAVLAAAPEKLTAPLMNSVTAVLAEAELPDAWQVFCRKDDERQIVAALQV